MDKKPTAFCAFPTTRWSLIALARDGSLDQRQKALEDLCQLYWLPLYAFCRKKGYSPADAEDATQDFLVSFLERGDFNRSDKSAGKMRNFLLKSFSNFLLNEYRARTRQKRGGGHASLSLQDLESEGRYHAIPSENTTPETIFDRAWAFELLDFVLEQMENTFRQKNMTAEFDALSPYLNPVGDEPAYSEVANRLDIGVGAVKTMVHRFRRQYRELLHSVVRETLVEDADVEEEIRSLIAILRES